MSIVNNERYARYYHRLGMAYQRPEIRASIEVIFSVFMVILLIFAAIRPTLTNLAALQKRIADKESINTKADKKIAQLFSAQDQILKFQNELILYDSAVSDNYNYVDMFGRIELQARNAGLEIESLSAPGIKLIGEGKAAGEWATKLLKPDVEKLVVSPVDFQVSGKPSQIRKFLAEIENMDRLTVIKSVNLIKESGLAKGTEKIKASGQISFYFLDKNQ